MIGFISQPAGRLGNVLLQYLFLRELASKTKNDFFHPDLKGKEYFEGLNETPNYKRIKRKIFNKRKIKLDEIRKIGLDEFLKYVEESEKILTLIPPVLGYTFNTLYENPNDFLKIKKEFQRPYFDYKDQFVVAIHFRGTDFADWNPIACLDADYYLRAVEYCVKKYGNHKLFFSLFTDDLTIESYNKVVSFLKENNYSFNEGNPQRNLGEECYNISISDIVVSSPSTFAITASMLGKKKTIIHSKKWCDYCIERNDAVWVEMMKNECDYYKIECVL
ncbi:MAG: hypothetical protein ACLTBS_00315 [Eisenbergiella sp.]